MPIICAIADQARSFIIGRFWRNHVAGSLGSQLPDCCRIDRRRVLFAFPEDPPPFTKQLEGAAVKRRCGECCPLDESSSSDWRHIHLDQFPATSSLVRLAGNILPTISGFNVFDVLDPGQWLDIVS
jgi:hypothetical protein